MKKINIFSLILISVISFSCNDFLDVMPDNRAEVDTKEKVTKLLLSAYSTASPWLLTEFSSDNVDENGVGNYTTFSPAEEQLFHWEDVNDITQDTPQWVWNGYYNAVASSNQALQAIEELGNADGSLNPQKGEAIISRAFSHFVLANVFCKHYSELTGQKDLGIPYMEEPETTVAPKYDRGTVAEVYEKINRDIEAALPLIDDDLYSVPKYHFNKRAAYAFAARFNLYYRKYDNVIRYANLVLGADTLASLRDWQALGKETNLEALCTQYVDVKNRANLLLSCPMSWWPWIHNLYEYGQKYAHNRMISDKETTGSMGPWGAYTNFYYTYFNRTPKIAFVKFLGYFHYTDAVAQTGQNYMIQTDFTTDETLLCRAEAYAMLGKYEEAANDLNVFMRAFSTARLSRASINSFYQSLGYYTPEVPTAKKKLNPDFTVEKGEQENFIHCILHLRRILTLHEGLRWYDIKRYGIEITRRKIEGNAITVYSDKLTKEDPRRAIQLPQAVIDAGLTKNPR
jgi:hypothetical protein